MAKFKVGDRVVATVEPYDCEAGTVVRVHSLIIEGYAVMFDREHLRGPLGDGAVFMDENELESEVI